MKQKKNQVKTSARKAYNSPRWLYSWGNATMQFHSRTMPLYKHIFKSANLIKKLAILSSLLLDVQYNWYCTFSRQISRARNNSIQRQIDDLINQDWGFLTWVTCIPVSSCTNQMTLVTCSCISIFIDVNEFILCSFNRPHLRYTNYWL